MVNNEFHLIGVAITDYENIGNKKFISYVLKVQVEKFGAQAGKSFIVEVQIYGTNRAVDVKKDVLGQLVAVNGYIDYYETKDGRIITKLVAQNVYVLDDSIRSDIISEAQVEELDVSSNAQETLPEPNDIDDISPTDDLPF